MEVSGKRGLNERYKTGILCQPCKDRGFSTCSDGFCTQCEEHMCKTCFDTHKQFRFNREHTLGDTSECDSVTVNKYDLEKCNQHLNEPVKFYCPGHNLVGCGDCMILEHKTCEVKYICDIGKTFKDSKEFNDFIKSADDCHLKVKEITTSIENNKKRVRDIHGTFIQDVNLFIEDMISHINQHKNSIIRQADFLKSLESESMDEIEKENEELMKEMSRLTELFESQSDEPNKLFVSYVLQKPKLKRLQETYDYIKKRNWIKNYNFKPDCSLERSVKGCKKLGTIQQANRKDALCTDPFFGETDY